jgi:hypothetical protein
LMISPCAASVGWPRRASTIRARLVKVPPEPDQGDVVPLPPAPRLLELLPHLGPERVDFLGAGLVLEEILLGEPHRAQRKRLVQLPPAR